MNSLCEAYNNAIDEGKDDPTPFIKYLVVHRRYGLQGFRGEARHYQGQGLIVGHGENGIREEGRQGHKVRHRGTLPRDLDQRGGKRHRPIGKKR